MGQDHQGSLSNTGRDGLSHIAHSGCYPGFINQHSTVRHYNLKVTSAPGVTELAPQALPLVVEGLVQRFLVPFNKGLLPLVFISLLLSMPAIAGDNTRHYHIPAQSLNNALMQFAADSHLELMFTAEKIRGLRTDSLDGNMIPAQGLSRLLQGTGMTYRFVDAKTVTVDAPDSNIIKTAAASETPKLQSGGGDTTLPKVTVEADSQAYDPAWERDTRNPRYNRTHTTTAAKTDTPIMETPGSIQVVPKKVLDDQQAYDVKEALKNVSGIQQSTSPSNYENLVIRGFDASGSVYKNGIRQEAFAEETANLERIEVLKGPAAMLYGRIEPGGLVNLQTAKPLSEAYYTNANNFLN